MEWRIQGEKFGAPTPQRSVAHDGWRPLDINALFFGAYRSRNSDQKCSKAEVLILFSRAFGVSH